MQATASATRSVRGMTDGASPPSHRSPAIHLYQIAYSTATRDAIEAGYLILDNTSNERPDWYEYWPIRRFLLNEALDSHAFYGFFSTKFAAKTNLSHRQVHAFVSDHATQADVVLFSPQPDLGSFFLNVFEQAEVYDPGFDGRVQRFSRPCGRPLPLHQIVMDSRQVVFSNYFVAKPAFWREWLALNEALFAICEGPAGALKDALLHQTSYPGAVQRKVFLQERAASLILATQSRWCSVAHNPYGMGWSTSRFRDFPAEAVISDALKMAFRDQNFPQYLDAFAVIRDRFCASAGSFVQPQSPTSINCI